MSIHPMILHLLNNPEQVPNSIQGWFDLAVEFDFSPDQKNREYRANAARTKWKRFIGSERGLELKRVSFDKNGNPTSKTIGRAGDDRAPDLTNAEWYEHTTNANGGAWTKYRKASGYGLTVDQAAEVGERLKGVKFKAAKAVGSGVGLVDLSDLHTGAVLKYAVETIKTLPFDIEILTGYIDEAVNIINGYGFEKLHVFLPGDLVESFTAFNHRDSWRHVQHSHGGVTLVAYQVLKRLLTNLQNVEAVYMIEGNHDRMTSDKEGNSRKGIAEVLAFFLSENSGLNINYHPWLIGAEIDSVYHLCTHGDHKPFLKNDFWFRYGKQGMYNVLRTGHFHGFNVLRQTQENLHYQCPSIFTGNFFSESIGFDAVPGITIVTHSNGIPRIDYRPLTFAAK